MSKGASFNYQFGTKKNWRRWMWNRISERVAGGRRDALCVYLPSSEDCDRGVALEKGFTSDNLIGVEKNKKTLVESRKSGLCVGGDFFEAIYAIQKTKKISVIYGDFCGGLSSEHVSHLRDLWLLPNTKDAVFALNYLRGRDGSFSAGRNLYRHMYAAVCKLGGKSYPLLEKHRGAQIWMLTMHAFAQGARSKGLDICEIQGHSDPEFFSYRSTSGQIFDSVVLNRPVDVVGAGFDPEGLKWFTEKVTTIGTRRSVAAILAHRTIRKQAA